MAKCNQFFRRKVVSPTRRISHRLIVKEKLFEKAPAEVRRLREQAKKEIRVQARKQWKEQQNERRGNRN